MKTRYHILIGVTHEEWGSLKSVICSLGWNTEVSRGFPEFGLTKVLNGEEYEAFRGVARRYGIRWSCRREDLFGAKELSGSQGLLLRVNREFSGVGIGPRTVFDRAKACPVCNCPLTPKGIVELSGSLDALTQTTSKLGYTREGALLLVSAEIRDAIENVSGFDDVEFLDVCVNGRVAIGWHVLHAMISLPKACCSSVGLSREKFPLGEPCNVCQRDCYSDLPDVPITLKYQKDICDRITVRSTWECFGKTVIDEGEGGRWARALAVPKLVCSPDIYFAIKGIVGKQVYARPIQCET
jgi:hypothetical protein